MKFVCNFNSLHKTCDLSLYGMLIHLSVCLSQLNCVRFRSTKSQSLKWHDTSHDTYVVLILRIIHMCLWTAYTYLYLVNFYLERLMHFIYEIMYVIYMYMCIFLKREFMFTRVKFCELVKCFLWWNTLYFCLLHAC